MEIVMNSSSYMAPYQIDYLKDFPKTLGDTNILKKWDGRYFWACEHAISIDLFCRFQSVERCPLHTVILNIKEFLLQDVTSNTLNKQDLNYGITTI